MKKYGAVVVLVLVLAVKMLAQNPIDQAVQQINALETKVQGNKNKTQTTTITSGYVTDLESIKKTLTPPAPQPPGTWKGEYWNSGTGTAPTVPTTTPNVTRFDPAVDFNWGAGAPAVGINADHFIVRWTKTDTLAAGDYQFTLVADDGIRLWLDGAIVVDQWRDTGAAVYTATRSLVAGAHTFKIEYYENTGETVARFSWAVLTPPTQPPPTPTCSFTLGSTSATASVTGSSGDVQVAASDPTCTWSSSSAASWVTVTPVSGQGTRAATWNAQVNTGVPRSAVLTIAGVAFTVSQPDGTGGGTQPPPSTAGLFQASDFTFTGCYWDYTGNAQASSASQGLALWWVGVEQRLVFTEIGGTLAEISVASKPCGTVITQPIRRWPVGGGGDDHLGLSYTMSHFYIASTNGYPNGSIPPPPNITFRDLFTGGTIGPVVDVPISPVDRRIFFGTITLLPQSWQSQFGFKPLMSFSGGSLSRITLGNANYAPIVYAFDTTGLSQPLSDFPDVATQRGVRLCDFTNYHDGGDPRPNGTTANPPSGPPAAGARFLCTRPDGSGYMSATDGYNATGIPVDNGTKRGVFSIMSGAKGKSWYCNSDACWEGRSFQVHIFDPAQYGRVVSGAIKPWDVVPSSMSYLILPGLGTQAGGGTSVEGNVSGSVWDNGQFIYIAAGLPGKGTYRIMQVQIR